MQGGKASVVLQDVQVRCFHVSPLAAAAIKTAMSKFDTDPLPYDKLVKNLEVVKKRLNRPLTLSEKVLYSHLDQPDTQVSNFYYVFIKYFENINSAICIIKKTRFRIVMCLR